MDGFIGTEGPNELDVARAADRGHVCAERFRDLDGKGAHATRRPVDQDSMPRFHPGFVAKRLQRGHSRNRHGGGLLEADVLRLPDQPSLGRDDILGERASSSTEDLVPRFHLPDVRSDRFHRTGEVDAEPGGLRAAQPAVEAYHEGRAPHVVVIEWIDGGRVNFYENLIVRRHRFFNGLEFQDLGGAVVAFSFHCRL